MDQWNRPWRKNLLPSPLTQLKRPSSTPFLLLLLRLQMTTRLQSLLCLFKFLRLHSVLEFRTRWRKSSALAKKCSLRSLSRQVIHFYLVKGSILMLIWDLQNLSSDMITVPLSSNRWRRHRGLTLAHTRSRSNFQQQLMEKSLPRTTPFSLLSPTKHRSRRSKKKNCN